MLIESVLESAEPYLALTKVEDVVIGLSLIAVELDSGHIGLSYVLREDLDAGCSNFPYVASILGRASISAAQWAVTGEDILRKAIANAVLTAASRAQHLEDSDTPDRPFGVEMKKTDLVGMVGSIGPVVKMLKPRVKEVYVFDKAQSLSGATAQNIVPMKEQRRVLSRCDVVMISGTTMINGTIDGLLDMCEGARSVVMIGPSTPMFPQAFADTKVSVLAGSWWKHENKRRIFKEISLAAGVPALSHSVIKKAVRVT